MNTYTIKPGEITSTNKVSLKYLPNYNHEFKFSFDPSIANVYVSNSKFNSQINIISGINLGLFKRRYYAIGFRPYRDEIELYAMCYDNEMGYEVHITDIYPEEECKAKLEILDSEVKVYLDGMFQVSLPKRKSKPLLGYTMYPSLIGYTYMNQVKINMI